VFRRSQWQMQWVFCTNAWHSNIQLTASPCRGEWYMTAYWFNNDCRRCEFLCSSAPLRLIANLIWSGLIMYLVLNWTNVVVTAILGGELHSYNTFAWLTHHASHHDRAIICHVSAIHEGADISHRHLPSCQYFRWSNRCNNNVAYFVW
jgi:hypothetical protein